MGAYLVYMGAKPRRVALGARRVCLCICVPLLCLLLLWSPLPAAQDLILVDLRLGEWSDRTRLVVETDKPMATQLTVTPRGLAVELEGLPAQVLRTMLRTIVPEGHPLLGRILVEEVGGGVRVHLSLRRAAQAQAFALQPMEGFEHRWVLDLFPEETPAAVREARIDLELGRTRIVLESEQHLDATLVMLSNPRRLVLELVGTDESPVLSDLSGRIGKDHPLVKNARLQRAEDGSLQLVLDLSGAVRADMFKLEPFAEFDHRLVLDLYPRDASGPIPSDQPTVAESLLPQRPEPLRNEPKPELGTEPPQPEAVVRNDGPTEGWYEVSINGQPTGDVALAVLWDGRLFLGGEDLRRWRMVDPPVRALEHLGSQYYPVDHLSGLAYELDKRAQRISLTAPARLFETTSLNGWGEGLVKPDPTPLGGFLNYEIFANGGEQGSNANALLDMGAFNGWGSVNSRFLARSSSGAEEELLRLDTVWTRDDPEKLRTLRIGDNIARGSAWGGSVRFGGLQWGRNFATQPGFVTMPMPDMFGEAALPSTVDLYINNALRMRSEVPSGPFTVDNLPVITGAGEARLVVRDILGREQVITADYYASQELLREGLHDFIYELGTVRENYGRASNDYGRALAAATHRYGFSDKLTGELRGEFLEEQQSVGLGADWVLPFGGVLNTALALSNGDKGRGEFLRLGMQRQGGWFNWSIDSQFASEDFVRLGMIEDSPLPRRQTRASLSFAAGAAGSFGFAYTERDDFHENDTKLLSASYRLRLGRFGQLSVSALHTPGVDNTSLNVHLSLPIAFERTSGSYSRSSGRGEPQETLNIQRGLPVGSGLGYNVRAGRGASDYQQLGISARSEHGTFSIEGARRGDEETSYQARASGGVAVAGGAVLHGRRLGESFGVVSLPDFPGVRVYAENQLVGRTNGRGYALVPRMRPYEKNRLSIEQRDLPLNAQIEALHLDVVPSFGSGLVARFPVKQNRDALLSIMLANGESLPLGASVEVAGNSEPFPVGRGGKVYLTGLGDRNRVRARWNGKQCSFEFTLEKPDEMMPELGVFLCEEV